MTDCRNCRRDTELYLCRLCTTELHAILTELPWLLTQLEITVTRQDRLNLGIVGKSGNASPSPINVGAMELSRNLRNQLITITRELCETGGWDTPEDQLPAIAVWLEQHLNAIACSPFAGQTMREIRSARDAILGVINRNLRMYCGPCVHVTAHNRHGETIECGHDIYAPRDSDEQVQCPRCRNWVDPREQLLTTISRRDLLPEEQLLETMDTLGEPISRVRLYAWIKDNRLQVRGYVHHGRIVPKKIRHKDPRVFSLRQARELRWHDREPAA